MSQRVTRYQRLQALRSARRRSRPLVRPRQWSKRRAAPGELAARAYLEQRLREHEVRMTRRIGELEARVARMEALLELRIVTYIVAISWVVFALLRYSSA